MNLCCFKSFSTINRTILELKPAISYLIQFEGFAINRTILELKQNSFWIVYLEKKPINRTILELKRSIGRHSCTVESDYQSNHFGIETSRLSPLSSLNHPINRTILELKHFIKINIAKLLHAINRTILELKLRYHFPKIQRR